MAPPPNTADPLQQRTSLLGASGETGVRCKTGNTRHRRYNQNANANVLLNYNDMLKKLAVTDLARVAGGDGNFINQLIDDRRLRPPDPSGLARGERVHTAHDRHAVGDGGVEVGGIVTIFYILDYRRLLLTSQLVWKITCGKSNFLEKYISHL